MSHRLNTQISDSIWAALVERSQSSGQSVSHLVSAALAEALHLDHHSIFQVSTSGAIVEGLFQGCVSVADLRRHGDFGVGTFENLDGEMIMIEGHCFQATSDGHVREVDDDVLTPFAVVTNFKSDQSLVLQSISDWDDLIAQLDALRTSDNMIIGIRVTGTFDTIDLRAPCVAKPGVGLLEATANQAEFSYTQTTGTLVGFWCPDYTRSISIPGYHVHFISDDRVRGGHVLQLSGTDLQLDLHHVSDVHLAIPETRAFLEADFSGDGAAALEEAERSRVK